MIGSRCNVVWLLAAFAAMLMLNAADAGESRLNVLFIICDDLNCDLGCYEHPLVESPNIDRLAKSGLRFTNAHCQYPLCGPSRASFMTGLYPDQTLIRQNAIRLRERLPKVQSLTQMFRAAGYTATRVGKMYHYNVPTDIGTPGHDDPDSWDHTINPRGRDKDDEMQVFSLTPRSYGGTLSWLAAEGSDEEQTDGRAATEAIRILQDHAKSKQPFFLAVGMYRPHTPYVAPKAYFEMYPPEKIAVPTVPEGYLDTLPPPARRTLQQKKVQVNLPEKTAKQAIQAYYASITFVDGQIGRILTALEELDLDENTIVVFTSDHGYHMGEKGHYQKRTLYDNATRVPLIIRVPRMQTAGKVSDSPAELIDFYPTLAELCALKPPSNLSGVSLAAVLSDPTAMPRAAALTQLDNGYSLRTSRYRYTEWGENGEDGSEWYDHASDPEEMVNLAEGPASVTRFRLAEELHQRIAEARRVPEGLVQIHPKK